MLRLALAILAVLTVAAAAALILLLPALVDREAVRSQLIAQLEAATGRTVTIEGAVDLRLLPRPHVSIAHLGVAESGGDGAPARSLLRIDRVELQFALAPLLTGTLDVREARLVRPVMDLARDDAGELSWPVAGTGEPRLPVRELRLDRVRVLDGSIGLAGLGDGLPERIDHIEAVLGAGSAQGPFAIDGRFQIEGRTLALEAELGRLDPQGNASLRLALAAENGPGDRASLGYRGLVRLGAADWHARGDFTLQAEDGGGLAALGNRLTSRNGPPAPSWLAQPIDLRGRIEAESGLVVLEELRIALAGGSWAGRTAFDARGAVPRLDVRLDGDRMVLPAETAPAGLDWQALLPAAGIEGRVDLGLATLEWGSDSVRRLRLTLELARDGSLVVEDAHATLPGGAELVLSGRVETPVNAPRLSGTVSAVGDDLRSLMTWLGFAPDSIAAERLRSFGLEGELVGQPGSIGLHRAVLRLDATRIEGSFALAFGERTRLAAAASANRLNLDAYVPETTRIAPFSVWHAALGDIDAAIDLTVERLTWRGLLLDGLRLRGELDAGLVTLQEFSASDVAEAAGHVVGSVDLGAETFDLAIELQAVRPLRLLGALDLAPPPALQRFAPLQLSGTIRGALDGAEIELDLQAAQTRLALAGELGLDGDRPHFDLDYRIEEGSLVALLRRLGALGLRDEDALGPFRFEGHMQSGTPQALESRFSLILGTMHAEGMFTHHQGESRPYVLARVVADPLDLDLATLVIRALEGEIGPVPALAGLPRTWLGAWPRTALDWSWLDVVDLDLELGTHLVRLNGIDLPGLALEVRIEDTRLELDRLLIGLDPGDLRVSAVIDGQAPAPEVQLELALDGIDSADLLRFLDLPPAIEGRLELGATLAGRGLSAYDLVGSLAGEVDLRVRDGRIHGLALDEALRAVSGAPEQVAARIAAGLAGGETRFLLAGGPFAVTRGVLEGDDLGLVLDHGQGTLAGTLDLLLWMSEFTLVLQPLGESDASGLTLQLLGPFDRIGVRAPGHDLFPALPPEHVIEDRPDTDGVLPGPIGPAPEIPQPAPDDATAG